MTRCSPLSHDPPVKKINVITTTLPPSPAVRLEGAAGHLVRPRHRHAQALCEFESALHGARTCLKKRLVAQQLHVRQPPLAQKPHVLRVLRPDRVHRLAAVLPARDHGGSMLALNVAALNVALNAGHAGNSFYPVFIPSFIQTPLARARSSASPCRGAARTAVRPQRSLRQTRPASPRARPGACPARGAASWPRPRAYRCGC